MTPEIKQDLIEKLTDLDKYMKSNHANLNLNVVVELIKDYKCNMQEICQEQQQTLKLILQKKNTL